MTHQAFRDDMNLLGCAACRRQRCRSYAGHNQLEHCAQAMYDIAEAAIKEAEMITNKRLEWLSGRDYAASEAGQVAAELLTARARIAALESENAILRVAAGPLVVAALETKGEAT
jgi:hypothetical protein